MTHEAVMSVDNKRIGEELARVKPAASGRQAVSLTREGKSNIGKAATGISGTSRSRLGKLVLDARGS
jgi:hypothetical protein